MTMRPESTMYDLFLTLAADDPRILAVYLNGSRTNPNVPKDIFQDYDLVFVVTETASFIADQAWLQNFGTILYMQYPDEHPDYPSDKENFYGWLMQFTDGVRVDLHVESLPHAIAHIHDDRLCKILLDKNNLLPPIPEPTDADHHIKKPTSAQFHACTNEFYWCTNNLAKGLWRKEMPYVQDMANFIVRKELEKMLSWKIGIWTDFQVSVGKSAKYMHKWLSAEEYQTYLNTYFGGRVEDAWESVFLMCALFDSAAAYVAKKLNYTYNITEANAAVSFLKHVHTLPETAAEVC